MSSTIEWYSAKYLPEADGEFLCYCRIPARGDRPATHRYMTLEFAEGAFWVGQGAPDNFVLFWAHLSPPVGETMPETRGRKARWICRTCSGVSSPPSTPPSPRTIARP